MKILFIIMLLLSHFVNGQNKKQELKIQDLNSFYLALIGDVIEGVNSDVISPNVIFWGHLNKSDKLRMHLPKKFDKVGSKALVLLSDEKLTGFSNASSDFFFLVKSPIIYDVFCRVLPVILLLLMILH